MNSSTSLSFFSTTYEYVAWTYSSSAVALCALLCVFGDFHSAFNIIDAVVMIYFLFFTASKFPNNVVDFSKLFGENHYSFFPNPIESIFSTKVYQSVDATFLANGYSSLFIRNASLQLNLVIIVLAAYVLLKIMSYIPNLEILKRFIFRAWEWNAMIYLFWVFSFQFLVFGFLQTKQFNVDTGLEITSIILMFISIGVSALFPLLFCYLIYEDESDLSIPASQRTHIIQYTCLILGLKINKQPSSKASNPAIKDAQSQNQINEGDQETVVLVQVNEPIITIPTQKNELQEDVYEMYSPYEQGQFSFLAKYTNVAVSVRRIAFALLITIIYGHIEIQMLCDCFFNVVLCVFYIWKRPYILHLDNYRNAVHEILFCLMQLIICAFNNLSSTSSYLSLLGWFYISFALTILLLSYLDLCYKLYRAINKYLQKRKNQENHVTVIPANKDIPLDDSNDQVQKPSPIPQENNTKQLEPTVNNQTQKSQSELQKTEQPNLQAEKTQQPLPQAEKTQTQLPIRQSDPKVQAPENTSVQNPSNQVTNRPILKESTEITAKNPILNTVNQTNPNKLSVMENKIPPPALSVTQTAISLQELPVFTRLPANNQPVSYSHQEVLETKQRFKKLLFTRNPFMSVEDEALIKIEKAQESRASIQEMKSHKMMHDKLI